MSIFSGMFGRDQDGSVVIGVEMDNRGLEKGLSESTSAIERESKKWDKAGSDAADNIGGSFTSVFTKIATGAAMAKVGAALGKLAAESINLASDLQEVQNVVDVTFGDRATDIDTWAKNARTQFGLTETQAKQFASTLGAMFKSGGISDDNLLVQMSTDLAGLAADMASFYNLDFDEAFQKIQSGITGITQPLKSLGINMSESNLSAFAEANGQLYSAMSEAEKMVLRYQYLMSVTADAQGDFARTSDGFANQMRLVQTNLDALKTSIGTALLPVVNTALHAVNDLISALNVDTPPTVMDVFASIDADTERKIAAIQATADSARSLLEVMEELGGTNVTLPGGETTTYAKIFEEIARLTQSGGDVSAYLSGLGLDVKDVTSKYEQWLMATRDLTNTIPGLSSVIDTETGAIDGGTAAVEAYIAAWEDAEKLGVFKAAAQQKASAYEQAVAGLSTMEFEAMTARELANIKKARLEAALNEAGLTYEGLQLARKSGGSTARQYAPFADMWNDFDDARKAAEQAQQAYEDQRDAIDEAYLAMQAANRVLKDAEENTEDLTDAMDELQRRVENGEVNIDVLKGQIEDLGTTLERMAEIVKETSDESVKDVDNMIHGFEKITTPAEKAHDALESLSKYNEDGTLNQRWVETDESIPSMQKMIAGLDDQLEYMQTYTQMLANAEMMGVDAGLLASLSDGSVESYDALKAIMEDPQLIGELNNAWKAVQAEKGTMASTMTDTKLAADEEFKGLVKSATMMIEDLDFADGAETAMYDTVEGIVAGIAASLPDLKQAVADVIAQLELLDSFGTVGFYGGRMGFGYPGGLLETDGSHAMGLDYVPFDNYLAQLHEGESILTAEEARVWRDFRYGAAAASNTIDYDALGSTMRENAGGNVYLDGRIVGNVISNRQADSYRGLERSGWRG